MTLSINRKMLAVLISSARRWTAAALVAVAGLVSTVPAAAGADPETAQKLDNATCLSCHEGNKAKPEGKAAAGAARELHAISAAKFGKSVHSTMQCVACHTEIVDAKAKHSIDPKASKPNCVACHEGLWKKAKTDPRIAKIPRLEEVADNIEAYKKSFHAKENSDDPTRTNASCNDCHDVHAFDVPAKGTEAHKQWRVNTPKLCGTACHDDQLEEYTDSIHGTQVLDEGNLKAAVCSDCHTAHSVGNTSAVTFKQAVTESCGDCHEKEFNSYSRTPHGKAAGETGGNIIRCANCHGSHGIVLRTKLPARTMVKQDNKLCITCHDSDKNFEKFAPLQKGQKDGDKIALKEPRPNLDVIHKWLPNAKTHWQSVRCIDCHISASPERSHEILGKDKAERKCVNCHTQNTALAARLYRHLVDEEHQKYGFANSIILANSYVIGATSNPLIDSIMLVLIVLVFLAMLGHGALRYIAAKSRRKEGKQ